MQTEDRLKIQANPITQKGVELKNHKKPTIFQNYSRICDSVQWKQNNLKCFDIRIQELITFLYRVNIIRVMKRKCLN